MSLKLHHFIAKSMQQGARHNHVPGDKNSLSMTKTGKKRQQLSRLQHSAEQRCQQTQKCGLSIVFADKTKCLSTALASPPSFHLPPACCLLKVQHATHMGTVAILGNY
jgi:hypothetical protein